MVTARCIVYCHLTTICVWGKPFLNFDKIVSLAELSSKKLYKKNFPVLITS